MLLPWQLNILTSRHISPLVSPCVGGSIVPPRNVYCIKLCLQTLYQSDRQLEVISKMKISSNDISTMS